MSSRIEITWPTAILKSELSFYSTFLSTCAAAAIPFPIFYPTVDWFECDIISGFWGCRMFCKNQIKRTNDFNEWRDVNPFLGCIRGRVFVASVSRLISHKPFPSLGYLKNLQSSRPINFLQIISTFWLNGWLDFYLDVFRFAFHSHSFSYSCMLNIFHRSKVSKMKRKKTARVDCFAAQSPHAENFLCA